MKPQQQTRLSTPNPKSDIYRVLNDVGSYATTVLVAVAQVIPLEEMSQMSFDSLLLEIQ